MEPITAKSALWRVRRPAKFLDISLEERVGYIADALLWYALPGNMDYEITIVDPWEECKCILDRSEHNYYHSNIPRRYVKDILPLLEKKFPECKITVDTKKIDIRWDEKLIEEKMNSQEVNEEEYLHYKEFKELLEKGAWPDEEEFNQKWNTILR